MRENRHQQKTKARGKTKETSKKQKQWEAAMGNVDGPETLEKTSRQVFKGKGKSGGDDDEAQSFYERGEQREGHNKRTVCGARSL